MCPRVAKAETRGGFLSGDFRWRFNCGAQGITKRVGILAFSMVNTPESVVWLLGRARAHSGSSTQAADGRMYQLHKVHGYSG